MFYYIVRPLMQYSDNKGIRKCLVTAAFSLGLVGFSQLSPAAILVISNKSFPVNHLTSQQIIKIFLKEPITIPGISNITAFNQSNSSSAYNNFYKDIFHWQPDQVDHYWSQFIFTGTKSEPQQLSYPSDAINAVLSSRGNIAYVDTSQISSHDISRVKILYQTAALPYALQQHALPKHIKRIKRTAKHKKTATHKKVAHTHITKAQPHETKAPVHTISKKVQPKIVMNNNHDATRKSFNNKKPTILNRDIQPKIQPITSATKKASTHSNSVTQYFGALLKYFKSSHKSSDVTKQNNITQPDNTAHISKTLKNTQAGDISKDRSKTITTSSSKSLDKTALKNTPASVISTDTSKTITASSNESLNKAALKNTQTTDTSKAKDPIIMISNLNTANNSTTGNNHSATVSGKNVSNSTDGKNKLHSDISRYIPGNANISHQPNNHNIDNSFNKILQHDQIFQTATQQPLVKKYIHYYQKNQTLLQTMISSGRVLLPYIYSQNKLLKQPATIALLPMILSNYNPSTFNDGRIGLWQMNADSSFEQGLLTNWWYDGRDDIVSSTTDALNVLQTYYNQSHNWEYAIAAYAAQSEQVQSILDQASQTSFWQANIPLNAKIVVAKLIALKTILDNPQLYHVSDANISTKNDLKVIYLQSQVNLKKLATWSKLSLQQLLYLNPGFKQLATPPDQGIYPVLVPTQNALNIVNAFKAQQGKNQTSWIYHQIRGNESIASIAKMYHTSTAILTGMNQMKTPSDTNFQAIIVPTFINEKIKVILQSNKNSIDFIAPCIYTVAVGDTITNIADKFNITADAITTTNQLANNVNIYNGQQLIIPMTNITNSIQMPITTNDTSNNTSLSSNELTSANTHSTTPQLNIPNNQDNSLKGVLNRL